MNSIDLKLEKSEIYKLNNLIEKIISKKDLKIELIIEEVFVNILTYSKCDYIKAKIHYENNRLTIEFIDNGVVFNPLLKENHELPESIEDAKVGGLGLYLTKSLSDELYYEYKNGENHFTVIKEINSR